jgi:hypothetical protein
MPLDRAVGQYFNPRCTEADVVRPAGFISFRVIHPPRLTRRRIEGGDQRRRDRVKTPFAMIGVSSLRLARHSGFDACNARSARGHRHATVKSFTLLLAIWLSAE